MTKELSISYSYNSRNMFGELESIGDIYLTEYDEDGEQIDIEFVGQVHVMPRRKSQDYIDNDDALRALKKWKKENSPGEKFVLTINNN